jgi:DNA-binding CsgD family transcriptional regulator
VHHNDPSLLGTSGAGEDERLRAVLDGLRSIADPDDPHWRPRSGDARAIVDGAWSALVDLLDDTPHAGAVLDMLRRLTIADEALVRAASAPRQIGEALARLESASPTMAELVTLGPQLVWISRAVYIADDPHWADEINRVGQDQPQPLVPGLHETEIVRRREAMVVTDVQTDTRVHRPIADASRSQSYVAAPIISGNKVVGLLHGDCYLQGRPTTASDCETLAAYAKGLQLALSRARAAEGLEAIGSALRVAANDCSDRVETVREFSLQPPPLTAMSGGGIPLATRVTRRAVRSVRDVLTAREIQILELMAEGRSNAGIATQLVISEGTVKQHVKHILRKLRAGNRVEAVSMLYQSDGA